MRARLELVKAAFQARAAYRMDVLLRLLSRVIALFARVAIWSALFGKAREAASPVGVISLHEMVTYVVVSTGVSIFVLSFAAHGPLQKLRLRIRSGAIETDLIKPLGLKTILFWENIGSNLFEMFFVLIPLVVIGVLVFRMDLPSWQDLMLFGIALVNGLIVYFLLSYTVGLLAFWYLEIWHLERFLEELLRLFSGSSIPLWFFPPFLVKLSAFLPFRLVYFVPITIYLGRMELSEAVGAILQQVAWIGVLFAVERVVWAAAVKRLVIQGG